MRIGTFISNPVFIQKPISYENIIVYIENYTKDTVISSWTSTSKDNITWSEWIETDSGLIQSPALQWIKVKVEITTTKSSPIVINKINLLFIDVPPKIRIRSNRSKKVIPKEVRINKKVEKVRVRSIDALGRSSAWVRNGRI